MRPSLLFFSLLNVIFFFGSSSLVQASHGEITGGVACRASGYSTICVPFSCPHPNRCVHGEVSANCVDPDGETIAECTVEADGSCKGWPDPNLCNGANE